MNRGKNVLWMLLAAGVMASAGCASDGTDGTDGIDGMDGEPGDVDVPSVSAVSPSGVFLDRTVTVTISGNATEWTSAATVDFGADITVDDVIVASPTAIVADITIAESATTGRRDVSVSDGGVDVTFAGGFAIDAPLSFENPSGTMAQGSVISGRLRMHDVTTPFDTTWPDNDFPYLLVDAGAGSIGIVEQASADTIEATFGIGVNVAPGGVDFRSFSGDGAQATTSLAPDAITITARAPIALVAGANAGTVSGARTSTLYSFTPAPHQLVTIDATTLDADGVPWFVLLPHSGSFADLVSFGDTGALVAEAATPIYVVYHDGSGATGYTYDLNVTTSDTDDFEPNNGCLTAQTATAGATLDPLFLTTAADEDWFHFTAVAGDIGKVVHVVTSPGDSSTDTLVEVFTGTCAALVSMGGESDDAGYHEDHTSTPLTAAGSYWVRVSYSPFGFDEDEYVLDVTLE